MGRKMTNTTPELRKASARVLGSLVPGPRTGGWPLASADTRQVRELEWTRQVQVCREAWHLTFPCARMHTRPPAHLHVRTDTYAHRQTHRHTQRPMHACAHTHAYTHARTCARAGTHTRTCGVSHTRARVRTQTQVGSFITPSQVNRKALVFCLL